MFNKIEELFKGFIHDIIKVFPEYKVRLNKYYGPIINDSENKELKDKLLNDFIENIEDITKDICDENIDFFKNDPIILQNVSFKVIWTSNITNETKINIWKYLQSFCMYHFNKSEEEIDEIIKSLQQNEKIVDKDALIKARRLKKLSESIKTNSIEKKLTPILDEKGDESIEEIDNILENTSIGKIAKEVTEELNIEDMLSDGGGIENLMSGDNMINIFQSISKKIDSSNEGGNNIMEEAMGLSKTMQNNPLFTSMFSGLSGMVSQDLMKNEVQENMDNRRIRLNDSHNGGEVKERLRKKLKKKENKLEVNKKQ